MSSYWDCLPTEIHEKILYEKRWLEWKDKVNYINKDILKSIKIDKLSNKIMFKSCIHIGCLCGSGQFEPWMIDESHFAPKLIYKWCVRCEGFHKWYMHRMEDIFTK